MATDSTSRTRHGLRDAVRTFNKHVLNPVMLHLAGRRFWYAARLEHVGRRSGRRYATPIVAHATAGGFHIPLPYGTHVDWLRNLQAAGNGVLVDHGRRYTLSEPRVFPTAEILEHLSRADRATSRVYRIPFWLSVAADPAD